MKAHGQAHKYGDNIDTDVIIPARYLNTSDPKELGALCMIDIDQDFVKKTISGKHFAEYFYRDSKDEAIKAYLKELH